MDKNQELNFSEYQRFMHMIEKTISERSRKKHQDFKRKIDTPKTETY